MVSPHSLLLVPAVCAAVLASGCGNERTLPPDVATPGPPLGSDLVRAPRAGLSFQAPAGWQRRARPALPLVASISTGRATINVFRYARSEPLPQTRAELRKAAAGLVGAARLRDATLVSRKTSVLRVDGQPAVVVRATETIAGQPRTVRSTHVYADGGEVVVDAIAPAADFKRVDAQVFRPVVRSLRFTGPAA